VRRSLWVSLIGIVLIAIFSLSAVIVAGWHPQLGLDLQGGASVVLAPKHKVDSGTLDQAINIVRNRVDGLGVAEPDISRQGNNIVVELPGVKNKERALQVVGQTAELRFRPVIGQVVIDPNAKQEKCPSSSSSSSTTSTTAPTTSSTTAAPGSTTTTAAPTSTTAAPTTTTTTKPPSSGVAATPQCLDNYNSSVILPQQGSKTQGYQLGPAQAKGNIISSARTSVDPNTGEYLVEASTHGKGSSTFKKIAQDNVNKPLAIVLDHEVVSAPTIQPDLASNYTGNFQITGNFSHKEASNLALVLRYGSLPVELQQQQVQTVSATLGKDSLHAGIIAGAIGLFLVALYMILYYRALGIVVLLGLSVSAALLWSIISWLGHSQGLALTLSGAVGIIVSVGVTVDSYIVYFERLKDEIRSGKTVRSSVERGFSRAYRTILAADLVSLIGAALLYWLTVGPVRGFAFFLGLSTLLDIIVAYFFTRPMVILLGGNRVFTEAKWFGIARGLAAMPAGSTS
jgi:preprotein translocase subunit SecD